MPKDYRPPSPKTVSNYLYLAVLVIALLLAYVAVRALFS